MENSPGGPDPARLEALNKESERQWSRKASLEQRGITVITTSGVLVTLVFGFVSAVTKGQRFGNFGSAEKVLLFVALGLFIVAAVFGVLTNMPGRVGTISLERLTSMPVEEPLSADDLALSAKAIESVRAVNKTKANQLVTAFWLQIAAVLTLGATVIAVLE